MKKVSVLLVFAMLATLALAACSGSGGSGGATIDVTMSEFSFSPNTWDGVARRSQQVKFPVRRTPAR